MRGGGIVGEHDVRSPPSAKCVTLSHQALDRAVFADGALAAALWVGGQAAGPLLDAGRARPLAAALGAPAAPHRAPPRTPSHSFGERNAPMRICPSPARISTARPSRATRAHTGLSTQCAPRRPDRPPPHAPCSARRARAPRAARRGNSSETRSTSASTSSPRKPATGNAPCATKNTRDRKVHRDHARSACTRNAARLRLRCGRSTASM